MLAKSLFPLRSFVTMLSVSICVGVTAGQAPSSPPASETLSSSAPVPMVSLPETSPGTVCPEPASTQPAAALPGLPPGVGMGGFPTSAAPLREVNSFSELNNMIHDNLTVRLRGKGTLRPYGTIRGDLDFASNKFNDIQNPFFVLPADPTFKNGPGMVPSKEHDPNYSIYPRLSRLGFEYFGNKIDELDGITPSGRLEMDFLTPNTNVPGFNTESREFIRLRLAYAQLQWNDWTLVVGQDWDIISPLLPTIDDNTVLWNAGNMGDRRPIAKLLWDHDFGDGYRVQVQNGISLGDAIDNLDLDQNGFRDQEDSGLPAYQGRVGLVIPTVWGRNQPLMAGVWGFLSKDSTNKPIGIQKNSQFTGRGIGFDLRIPITEQLAFQGEAFYGRNLDDFRGGIGQGINAITGETIESRGGWLEFVYRPIRRYQISVGCSIDDPTDADLPHGGRKLNYVWYVGNRFPVSDGLLFGVDFQNWTTEYVGFRNGHANLVKLFMSIAF